MVDKKKIGWIIVKFIQFNNHIVSPLTKTFRKVEISNEYT